jgi:ATP-binding cassette subfamily B (MDR/TAP) protein 1
MSLAPHTVAFGRAATASVELFKLIDRESEINAFDDSGVKPEQITGTITMEDVSFCYPTRPEVTVLDKFCLTVPAGKVTALVVSDYSPAHRCQMNTCSQRQGTQRLREKYHHRYT